MGAWLYMNPDTVIVTARRVSDDGKSAEARIEFGPYTLQIPETEFDVTGTARRIIAEQEKREKLYYSVKSNMFCRIPEVAFNKLMELRWKWIGKRAVGEIKIKEEEASA